MVSLACRRHSSSVLVATGGGSRSRRRACCRVGHRHFNPRLLEHGVPTAWLHSIYSRCSSPGSLQDAVVIDNNFEAFEKQLSGNDDMSNKRHLCLPEALRVHTTCTCTRHTHAWSKGLT
jgi:hypothetical protein